MQIFQENKSLLGCPAARIRANPATESVENSLVKKCVLEMNLQPKFFDSKLIKKSARANSSVHRPQVSYLMTFLKSNNASLMEALAVSTSVQSPRDDIQESIESVNNQLLSQKKLDFKEIY